jgi:plasmid maintenance system antidote protein VapI
MGLLVFCNMEASMKAGRVLKEELKVRQISQEHFAHICGVTTVTINQIINGKTGVTIKTAAKIMAQSDNVTANDWFTE